MTKPITIPFPSSARRNRPAINQNAEALREVQDELGRINSVVAQVRRLAMRRTEAHPFRVYLAETATEGEEWRTFNVQHGYANSVSVTGCDDNDGEGTTATAIVVPASSAEYRIWLKLTLTGSAVTAAAIEHGATGWPSYPAQSGLPGTLYVLLAQVDTLTWVTEQLAIVRQFLRTDLVIAGVGGGGGDAVWLP